MISNLIVSNQKFVLIVDDVGLERFSHKFIAKWLEEQGQSSYITIEEDLKFGSKNGMIKLPQNVKCLEISDKKTAILPSLSKLLLSYNAAGVFQLVNQLKKNSSTKQLYLWATSRNISEHFVIPFLEYMADLIVYFIDSKHLSVTTRKTGGLVSKKVFMYELASNMFSIKSIKEIPKKSEEPTVKPEDLGTFKIDLNEEELIARNALKLPYERTSDESSDGRIIYTPDADDDFDDEDPDEDLYI